MKFLEVVLHFMKQFIKFWGWWDRSL